MLAISNKTDGSKLAEIGSNGRLKRNTFIETNVNVSDGIVSSTQNRLRIMNYKSTSTRQMTSNYIAGGGNQKHNSSTSSRICYTAASPPSAQMAVAPPTTTLTGTSSSAIKIIDKQTKHHYCDVQYVGLCGCHRISRSNCVTALCELIQFFSLGFSPHLRLVYSRTSSSSSFA